MVTSFFSLILLAASGWLLDSHRRDWDRVKATLEQTDGWRFARNRYRRRMIATSAIAVVGVLVAFWPLLPRTPGWVLPYTGCLALLAILVLGFGLYDALATRSYYAQCLREQSRQHHRDLLDLVDLDASDTERIKSQGK